MRKIASLIIALGVLAFFVGCAKDVYVEPPPSLTGDYTGIYVLKEGSQVPIQEYITWRFSQNGYQMRQDTVIEKGVPTFCNNDGQYELENGVTLNETNPNVNRDNCNTDQNPTGFFQLDQSTDTLKMTQFNSQDDVFKTIKLVKTE